MAYSTSDSLYQYGDILERKIKQLLNSDLKAILKAENLPVSGIKSALQDRILDHVRKFMQSEDVTRFNELYTMINGYGSQLRGPPFQAAVNGKYQSAPPSTNRSYPTPNGHGSHGSANANGAGSTNSFTFKKSPFYEIRESFCQPIWLPIVQSSKSTSTAIVSMNYDQVARISSDPSFRVMVYCAADTDSPPKDLSFPSQLELKCNGETYSGNLKGVKKRPGTTKPADITSFVRKLAGFKNQVALTYAATDKRFLFCVYLVRKTSVEQLVDKIRTGQFISKQAVVNEMISKAQDPDIVATSTVMSLKCPLSAMRIQLPCRSTLCNHNQCFDANSFLQLQEQAPQWSCPICNKTFKFDSLVVDQFVEDILRSTSSSAEQITIEPNGEWKQGIHQNTDFRVPNVRVPNSGTKRKASEIFDVDGTSDLVSHQASSIRGESGRTSSTPQALFTPTFTSREPSSAASTVSRSTSKRPMDDVIDLTLSDGDDDAEDEGPRRPIKRQSTGGYVPSTPQTVASVVNVSHSGPPRLNTSDTGSRPSYVGYTAQSTSQNQPGVSFPVRSQHSQLQQSHPQHSSHYGQNYNPGYHDGYGEGQQGTTWRNYR